MKTKNNILKSISLFFFITFLGAGYALAGTIEGTVQGLNCVLHGKICPVDSNDPHLAAENIFIIYSGKKDYKIVSNLDRSVLSKYLGHKVRLNGEINKSYNSIEADTFQVMKDGKFKTVWTERREFEERSRILRGGGGGR